MKRIVTAIAAMACAALAVPASAQEITGVWNVITKPIFSSCTANDREEAGVFQWLMKENAGTVKVDVQGETGYPKLTGTLRNGWVTVEGPSKPGIFTGTDYLPNAVWMLQVHRQSLSGRRYLSHFKQAGGYKTTCLVIYEVTAKQQM